MSNFARNFRFPTVWHMKNEILATIAQGTLRGTEEEGMMTFYRIPYGTNAGRFHEVGAAPTWEGTRDASEPGPVFPQNKSRLSPVLGNKPGEEFQSEDAFHVNVWTPSLAGSRAVLFWIHGGAWVTGGGALPWYRGANLAKNGDVVVVTVSYRLGVLGTLNLPGVANGNMAVGDLLAALKWTKENIAAFGGDPDRMTVAGQSAGAWYTVMLSGHPEASKLFKRSIALSYPGSFTPISKERATELAEALVEELGCKDNPARIADVPIADVLKAQETAPKKAASKHHHLAPSSFLPIAGDHGVPKKLEEAVVNYSGGSKELMMGVTSEEAAAFLHKLSLPKPIYRVAVKLAGKKVFEKPTEHLLEAMNETGSKVYLYCFSWQSPKRLFGAPHCIDLPFMFGNLDDWADAPMLEGADAEKLRQLSQRLQGAVLRFVKNGSPSSEEEAWPEYCGDKEMTVIA